LKGLEKYIKEEFGKKGLKKFKDSNLKLKIELISKNLDFFDYSFSELYCRTKEKTYKEIGKKINLNSEENIKGYSVKNAEVFAEKVENVCKIFIDFELQKEKFLRIAFNLSN